MELSGKAQGTDELLVFVFFFFELLVLIQWLKLVGKDGRQICVKRKMS